MKLDYATPPGHSNELSPEALAQCIVPLRRIFWGSLLLIFDITFSETHNGTGFRFDILDDTVGMLLITFAVFRLAQCYAGGNYAPMMTFVKVVCVLKTIASIDGHFIYPDPPLFTFLRSVLGLAALLGIVVFCSAMAKLALLAALLPVARSWRTTRLLFILIYVGPLGFLYLAALGVMLGLPSFNVNLGAAGLLLLAVFVVPPVHFFVSTSRFRRAIEAMTGLRAGL